jgi:hypothetical protein
MDPASGLLVFAFHSTVMSGRFDEILADDLLCSNPDGSPGAVPRNDLGDASG